MISLTASVAMAEDEGVKTATLEELKSNHDLLRGGEPL